jgi:non-ribosomal peptide synthetase component F
VNEYGPSEATVWATAGELRPDDGSVVTIGRPVPFTRVHLLDPEGRPVPVGAPGEICLAGDTVARGYLGGEEAGGFVADPFHPGGRMYRTGDRGRFREDGRLDFLGRLDDQLKVRGFRIEPGEIEGILDGAPGVAEAAVVHRGPGAVPDVDALVRALVDRAGDDAEALLLRLLVRT